jgi:hypothetical protein
MNWKGLGRKRSNFNLSLRHLIERLRKTTKIIGLAESWPKFERACIEQKREALQFEPDFFAEVVQ